MTYTLEFRLNALKKLEENKGNLARTAREIGVNIGTLKRWIGPDRKKQEDFSSAILARVQRDLERVLRATILEITPKLKDANLRDATDTGVKLVKLINELATASLKPASSEISDKNALLDELKAKMKAKKAADAAKYHSRRLL